jgi:carboxyl-terminal processing protease
MLRSLIHIQTILTKKNFDRTKRLISDQNIFGIGASIQNVLGDDADTFATATFEGSPAWRAGLRYGDRIVEVDGLRMTGKASADVRDKIRGPRGSQVRITIEHAADKKIDTVQITRDAVEQTSIPDYYMLKSGVGYVDKVAPILDHTPRRLQNALDPVAGKGATSLRGTPAYPLVAFWNGQFRWRKCSTKPELDSAKGRNTRDGAGRRGKPDTQEMPLDYFWLTLTLRRRVVAGLQDRDRHYCR